MAAKKKIKLGFGYKVRGGKTKKSGLMDQWAKKRTTVIDTPYKKK